MPRRAVLGPCLLFGAILGAFLTVLVLALLVLGITLLSMYLASTGGAEEEEEAPE